MSSSKVYYFAYGSNMLSERFFVSNQGTRKGPGSLKDYCLGFNVFSKGWNGGIVSILEKKGAVTLGAVWEIDNDVLKSLDLQELRYNRIQVKVELKTGEIIECHSFEFLEQHMIKPSEESVTYGLLPSITYLKVIVKGAIESDLPKEYVDFLRTIRNNGKMAEAREKLLQLEDFHL